MKSLNSSIVVIIFFICGYPQNTLKNNDKTTMQQTELTHKVRSSLEESAKRFQAINHAFLFDVSCDNHVIFQVVHEAYVNPSWSPEDGFGMAIYLVFDLSFSESAADLEEFKTLEIYKDFRAYDWEGMQCYELSFGRDIPKGTSAIITLLEDLYGLYKAESVSIDITDQGSI